MKKSTSPTPITRDAVRRIAHAASVQNGGQIPATSHASRADAVVQRVVAANTAASTKPNKGGKGA